MRFGHSIPVMAAGLLAILVNVAVADSPARLPTDLYSPTGGDSITGSNEWSVIADTDLCALRFYRQIYATMVWNFTQQILEGNPCANTGFGVTSSIAGPVLVIGQPGWSPGNPRGAFSLYTFDGTSWAQRKQHNAAGAVPQTDSDFGRSVSVSRDPLHPNEFLIAIGAPLFDGPAGVDSGKVEVWRYNLASNTLSFVKVGVGSAANENLGRSVTTDFPYVLAGAPGHSGGDGAGYLVKAVDTNADTVIDDVVIGQASPFLTKAAAGERLGGAVSMSARYIMVSGDKTSNLNRMFVFENTLFGAMGNDPLVTRNYVLRDLVFPAANVGDVTQSTGVGAVGDGLSPDLEGAYLLRDPITDLAISHGVFIGFVSAVGAGSYTQAQKDLRLVRETLFVRNPSQDRAFAFRFPAGFGQKQPAFKFRQRSLPCNVAGKTVNQVFANLGVASTDGVNGDFVVYGYNPATPRSDTPYRLLPGSYTFVTDNPGDANWSVWLAVDGTTDAPTPGAPALIPTGEYASVADCVSFSQPDTYTTAIPPAPPVATVGGVPARVKAQKNIALIDAVGTAPDKFARVMVNNPFPREVYASDIRYRDRNGNIETLTQAQAHDELLATLYVWDEGFTIPSGQKYRAVTAAGTPPFQNRIEAQEGFWVRVLQNGINTPNPHYLIMPQTE